MVSCNIKFKSSIYYNFLFTQAYFQMNHREFRYHYRSTECIFILSSYMIFYFKFSLQLTGKRKKSKKKKYYRMRIFSYCINFFFFVIFNSISRVGSCHVTLESVNFFKMCFCFCIIYTKKKKRLDDNERKTHFHMI